MRSAILKFNERVINGTDPVDLEKILADSGLLLSCPLARRKGNIYVGVHSERNVKADAFESAVHNIMHQKGLVRKGLVMLGYSNVLCQYEEADRAKEQIEIFRTA